MAPKEDKTHFWDTIKSCTWWGKGKAVAGVVGKYGCEAGFELHGTEEKRGWTRRVIKRHGNLFYISCGNSILTLSYKPAGLHWICLSLVAGHDSDMGSWLSDQCTVTAIFHPPPALILSGVQSSKKPYFVSGKDPVKRKVVLLKLQIKSKCSNPNDSEWQFSFFFLEINFFVSFYIKTKTNELETQKSNIFICKEVFKI